MNKQESYAFLQYINSTAADLTEVYLNPSKAKREAFERIKSGMSSCNGKRMRIISHSSQFFSCAYLFKDENGKVYLAVFRPRRSFDVDVTDTVLGAQFGGN